MTKLDILQQTETRNKAAGADLGGALYNEVFGSGARSDRKHKLVLTRALVTAQSDQVITIIQQQPLNLIAWQYPVIPKLTVQL